MFSVMITVNYGQGDEIHAMSGTYGSVALESYIEHMTSLHNLVGIEIKPSM